MNLESMKMLLLNYVFRCHEEIVHIHRWSIYLGCGQIQVFKECRDAFANMLLAMEANIPLHVWWDLVGEGGTHLTTLAKHILVGI